MPYLYGLLRVSLCFLITFVITFFELRCFANLAALKKVWCISFKECVQGLSTAPRNCFRRPYFTAYIHRM